MQKILKLFILLLSLTLASLLIIEAKPTLAQLNWPPNSNPPAYSSVDADDAVPRPYVGCGSTSDPEFHSLRPYQASPCTQGVGDYALFCANTLIFEDFITVDCASNLCEVPCPDSCGTSVATCTCRFRATRDFYVDSFEGADGNYEAAELPIMGNTEDEVINSQYSGSEGIDHYAKVNEYVSWFLNGINQRAEYDPPDPTSEEGQKMISSFSGPIKKLLSWESLNTERNQQIERVGGPGTFTFDESGRHNQIVTCSQGGDSVSCYTTGGTEIRINQIEGFPQMSDYTEGQEDDRIDDLQDWINSQDAEYFEYIPLSSTEDRMGDLDIVFFQYQSYVGDIVSISGIDWARDWPIYLYFAHMEEARELADQLQRTYISAMLMRESGNKLLINSRLRKHVKEPEPPFCDLVRVRTNPGDTLAPGGINDDDLGGAGDMPVTLSYDIVMQCPVTVECTDCGGGGDNYCDSCMSDCQQDGTITNCYDYCHPECEGGDGDECLECIPQGSCQGTITWEMPLRETMPLADEDFNRLVGSPQSPFQRIFPHIERGGYPVQGIWDMPGYSLVDYESELTGTGPPGTGGTFELTDILNPGGYPDPPRLFYPHIGSIHQYFLDCIQTAVRPQGYGPYCPRGEPCPCEFENNPTPPPIPTIPPWEEVDPCEPGFVCINTSTYFCESNGGSVQYCSQTGNCCIPAEELPNIPTSTPPPLPTGPAGPLNCNDILPYEEYLDIVLGRGPDHTPGTEDDTAPWPAPITREDDLLYDFDMHAQCAFNPDVAADEWALCFANYAVGGWGTDAQEAMWADWEQIQDWGIDNGFSPAFLLALAAHESGFGTQGPYLGAITVGGTNLLAQLNALLYTIENRNLSTLSEFLCVWLQGNRIENCPPFTNPDGSPNNFGDEMRYWFEIFSTPFPAECQVQWDQIPTTN